MIELLFQMLVTPSRIRFRWRNRNRPAVSEDLATVLRERLAEVERAYWPAYRVVYNVGLFAALIDQDIWACSEAVVFARSAWHRRFHAKHLAVLLVEAAEDLTEMLAKEYDDSLRSLGLDDPWLDGRRAIHKKISGFRGEST